jgi:hypothetical protein
MISIADRLYDQKMKTNLLPVIYAVYVHVNWSALQIGFYLCITCHTVQWRGKKNYHMMHVHITRREGIRTYVRSDKDALHIAPISDIPSLQNSFVTAQICLVQNAIVTGIVCDVCRHEVMWLTAGCFGHSFFSSFLLVRTILVYEVV